MKKLALTVLMSGLLAGSLFASNEHKMDSSHSKMMNEENCLAMHKEFHKTKTSKSIKSTIPQSALDAFYPPEDIA